MCGRASLPISLVSVIGTKGDEQGDAGDEHANSVGMIEIIYQNGLLDLVLYLLFHVIVLSIRCVVEYNGGAVFLGE